MFVEGGIDTGWVAMGAVVWVLEWSEGGALSAGDSLSNMALMPGKREPPEPFWLIFGAVVAAAIVSMFPYPCTCLSVVAWGSACQFAVFVVCTLCVLSLFQEDSRHELALSKSNNGLN